MKKILIGAALVSMVMTASAEPLRTLFTRENQLPEKGQLELGAFANTHQYPNLSGYTESIYARYGLFGNLAAYAFAPYHQTRVKNGFGANLSGIGDIGLGFEVLPYEDIFKFPYIMPHLEIRFPTGDQDKGYGSGDVSILGGVTLGTKTWECVDWALDITGAHLTTNDPLLKNDTIIVSGSIVWNLDEQFALVTEVSGSDQTYAAGHPVTFEGGMVYKPIENLLIGIYGGKTQHTDESWNGTVKVAYSF
jgi:hypothetical protein